MASGAELVLQAFDVVGTILLWTWWIFLIGGMWLMKKRYSRYPIDAVIIEKRGDNLVKTNERLGRRENKETGITDYQLSKSKETIPVINFDWMLHNADKPLNIFEKIINFLRPTIGTVFLFKYGSRQYKPINVTQNPEAALQLKEMKDKKGQVMYQYSYNMFDPRWVLGVLDFEVVDWDNMNFMVQEQRSSVMRRAKGLDWLKSLAVPAMIIGGSVLCALFILKFSAETGASLSQGGGQPAQTQPEDANGGVISGAIGGVVNPDTAPGG